MLYKVPNSSGNGYYGHETIIFLSADSLSTSSISSDDLDLDTPDSEFTDYLWMEHEEEFEKEVMQQLEEEELTEQCLEDMRQDEIELRNLQNSENLELTMEALKICECQVLLEHSNLNPNAAEFVPSTTNSSQQ